MKKLIQLTHKTSDDPAERERITDFVWAIANAYDGDLVTTDGNSTSYVLKISKELADECTTEVESQDFEVVAITIEKAKVLLEKWPPLPRRVAREKEAAE
jgi:hypothetical protein